MFRRKCGWFCVECRKSRIGFGSLKSRCGSHTPTIAHSVHRLGATGAGCPLCYSIPARVEGHAISARGVSSTCAAERIRLGESQRPPTAGTLASEINAGEALSESDFAELPCAD